MVQPNEILKFWLDEVGPEGWYLADNDLDARIRDRFLPAWTEVKEGGLGLWLTYPSGSLAYIILTDQLSRNMFRGSGKAFELDVNARAVTKAAIHREWDLKVDGPARQFFYLPLEHSENLCDQDRAVRLIKTRMPGVDSTLLHARAHREIIRKFGRFPFRNEALGRATSEAEAKFMAEGAYGSIVRTLQEKTAA